MNWLLTLKTYLHTTNKRHFLSFKSILSMSMSDMVSVKLPPKKIPPHNCLSIIAHWENWPLHDCPGLLLPDNYHKDNCPPPSPTIFPWKLPLEKIAFRIICRLHNAPRANGPEKNCPQENSPKDNLHQRYFFPRIRNLRTSIDSCFLFSFFVV